MIGMKAIGFSAETDDDVARFNGFHLDLPPVSAICQVAITGIDEFDDESGATVGFTSITFLDERGQPQQQMFDVGLRRSHVGHNRLIRVDFFVRLWSCRASGLLNVFIWPDGAIA